MRTGLSMSSFFYVAGAIQEATEPKVLQKNAGCQYLSIIHINLPRDD